jgi:A/G-specific adenine glycosylase
MSISGILEEWYIGNKRKLPWRDSDSAYRIWLSEIILQQTRVNQGIKYYERFVERYPCVEDLAKAPVD